jgi:hypothetical protein
LTKRFAGRITRIAVILAACSAFGQADGPRTRFKVTYVASEVVYVDGGREAGLAEGFHLTLKRRKPGDSDMEARVVAELSVVSVASTSAVCELKTKQLDPEAGDIAWLSPEDAEILRAQAATQNARTYAQVVSFTDGDPLDEEARKYVSKPPLPEINHLRGRIAFEQDSIIDHGVGGATSMQEGMVLRADMTRMGGTYWNFTGYWRGRLDSTTGGSTQTLNDLLNRTYTIGLSYNNPDSKWEAGLGRLYVPWATSLNTIDGGYLARKLGRHARAGIFAGTTPDPASWNFNPHQQMGGAFVNWEVGSFEDVRYDSTVGLGLSRVSWHPERQFMFLENSISYKNVLSIYHNFEVDDINPNLTGGKKLGPEISRSFLTFRLQPNRKFSLDLSHNYFRNLPTFNQQLLGTGLLDQFLFQGFSGGVHVDLPYSASLYTTVGRSRRDGDARSALNQMYGLTFRRLWFPVLRVWPLSHWWTSPFLVWDVRVRTDLRYSRFNTSFGSGSYETLSLSKDITDRLRVEVLGGQQNIVSTLTNNSRARFMTADGDWFFSRHYSIGAGATVYRGQAQNYDQIYFNLGYRF